MTPQEAQVRARHITRRERIDAERLCNICDLAQSLDGDEIAEICAKIDQNERDLYYLETAPTPAPLKVVADSGCRPVSQLPPILLQTSMKPSEFRNGYLDTEILEALASRLEGFQNGPMACDESKDAAELIRRAVTLLRSRVTRRKAEGTYGSMTEAQPEAQPPKKVRAIFHQGNVA